MKVECPRCATRGQESGWHATGRFNVSRFNRVRAELDCDRCRYTWSSGLPEAIAAGEIARGEAELPELRDEEFVLPAFDALAERENNTGIDSEPLPVPQPSLPGTRSVETDHGFVSAWQLAGRAIAEFKRRQTGEAE